MREWHLTANDPIAPRIAADARSGRTTFDDDQTWQLRLGGPQEPAMAFETRYGGRVGLARLVPIWFIGRRQVYETQGYHQPPAIAVFAPDYLRVSAALTITLQLTAEFWVMESQAVGGQFTLTNSADSAQSVQLGLTAQAMVEEQEMQKFFLTLETGDVALQTFRLRGLQPVLLLEGAQHTATKARLSRTFEIAPGATVSARWVLGSLSERDASLALAYKWLLHEANWETYFGEIEQCLAAVPDIQTGHTEWDAALAWSQQLALRSFLGATGSLPYPSFVRSRKTNQGYAVTGTHASGFTAPWGGQSIMEALAIGGTVALSAPELAQGVVRNFLAAQHNDGWLDARPGLGGQRANLIAPPLLGTLALMIYEFTGDRDFLADTLDGAFGLFERWFAPDMDRNGDGLPEWSHPDQGAFGDSPTLAEHRRWAEGVDVSTLQAPDLAAYLLREIVSLSQIARILDRDDIAAELEARQDALREHLNAMWDAGAGHFHYLDRDTGACPTGELIWEGKGDQRLSDRTQLPEPGRLVLRVQGGLSRKPKMTCTVEGVTAGGQSTAEEVPGDAFSWYRGQGSASTNTVWSAITYLRFEGLSRVFSVGARTSDLTRPDMSLLMPLWSRATDEAQTAALLAALTDPDQYWRAYGIAACPANDPAYNTLHRAGCGGMWPDWNARFAFALIDAGERATAADLFGRVIAAQIASLHDNQSFRRFYSADSGEGLGDADDILGIVSLEWFARLFGVWARTPGEIAVRGPFAFVDGDPMVWTQHGVVITRSADGTQIVFPSGHTVDLPPDADPGVIRDPDYTPPKAQPPRAPEPAPPEDITPPPVRPDEGLLPDGV